MTANISTTAAGQSTAVPSSSPSISSSTSTTTGGGATTTVTAVSSGQSNQDDNLSPGAETGLGVGVAFGSVAIIILLVWYCLRRRRRTRRKRKAEAAEQTTASDSVGAAENGDVELGTDTQLPAEMHASTALPFEADSKHRHEMESPVAEMPGSAVPTKYLEDRKYAKSPKGLTEKVRELAGHDDESPVDNPSYMSGSSTMAGTSTSYDVPPYSPPAASSDVISPVAGADRASGPGNTLHIDFKAPVNREEGDDPHRQSPR